MRTWFRTYLLQRLHTYLPQTVRARLPDPAPATSPWMEELDDWMRAAAGALLFGVPFLYTMEVWSHSNTSTPPALFAFLAMSLAALVALDRHAGFRQREAATWKQTLSDSLQALVIALLTAALSLFVIRRITPDMGFDAILARVIFLTLPFSLGVGVANLLLERDMGSDGGGARDGDTSWRGTLLDAGATMLGATFIAFSIAPTDEVPVIANSLSPLWLLGIMAASLLTSYIIVFEAEFGAQNRRRQGIGIFQSPLGETVFSYLLALVTSVVMLLLFNLVGPESSVEQWLSYTLVLGFPAAVGGAAGRLAV